MKVDAMRGGPMTSPCTCAIMAPLSTQYLGKHLYGNCVG